MDKNPHPLYPLQAALLRVVADSYSSRDTKILYEHFLDIALNYIRSQYAAGKLYLPIRTETATDLRNLATDAVADLFKRNAAGEFTTLRHYFREHLREVQQSPQEAFIATRRLVITKTKQEIVEFIRKTDPAGAKIYRNLKLARQRNPHIATFTMHGITYYYYRSHPSMAVPEDLNPTKPEIDLDDLRHWLLELWKENRTTPKVVSALLKELQKVSHYRWFLRESKLFKAVRENEGLANLVPMENLIDKKIIPPADLIDQDELFNALMKFLSKKIENTYVSKNKITPEKGSTYQQLLSAYFRDLLDGGVDATVEQYTSRYLLEPRHPKDLPRIEYLVKQGKNFLKKALT